MDFRILGPLEVRDSDGGLVAVSASRLRALLALLLLDVGRVVAWDRLVEDLWDGRPPPTAHSTLQKYVHRLRTLLGRLGTGLALATRSRGYVLELATDRIDAGRFDSLVADGTAALDRGELDAGVARLRAGLGLWRGPALADIEVGAVRIGAAEMNARRLDALERCLAAELALGRHVAISAELTTLAAAHPYREGLSALLMLALYRSGRQADALAAYVRTRQRLIEDLGIEPGARLRELHSAVLRSDPALEVTNRAVALGRRAWPVPAMLPSDIADFTGREGQATELAQILACHTGTAAALAVVTGPAGVGKTTFAVHVAHLLRARFPDGQLFADLRGMGSESADPTDVLAGLLTALGHEPGTIPVDASARGALLRSELAGRRCLVVLDDARDEAQVRPLLPGAAGCAAVVTARAGLGGLDGARRIRLGTFGQGEAVHLLSAIVGADRVRADRPAAEEVARLCDHLPLAVRIAGTKLAARPQWTLDRLAKRLADQRHRIDEMRVGDREVRSSVLLSYTGLPEVERRAVRRLALLDAPDFASWLVGAVLGAAAPTVDVEEIAGSLVEAGLIEYAGQDLTGAPRYRFHDLVRLCVREQAVAEDGADERRRVVIAAVRAWWALAERARERLPFKPYVDWVPGRLPPSPVGTADTAALLADPLAWFEAERAAIVVGVRQAAPDPLCVNLALALWPYAHLRGHGRDGRETMQVALNAAVEAGDRHRAALVLVHLGWLEAKLTEHKAAERHHRAALEIFTNIGYQPGIAEALIGVGYQHGLVGRFDAARRDTRRALDIATRFEAHGTAGLAMRLLAASHRNLGQDARAEQFAVRAMRILAELGDRRTYAAAAMTLARVYEARGETGRALSTMDDVVATAQQLGDRHLHLLGLVIAADLHLDSGDHAAVAACVAQVLDLAEGLGDRDGRARALHRLGLLHLAQRHAAEAVDCLTEVVRIYRELDLANPLARALYDRAEALAQGGDEAAAGAARREALALRPAPATSP